MFNRLMTIIGLAAALLFCQTGPAYSRNPSGIHLEPNLVPINATYNGANVSITGDVEKDSEVLILVSKEPEEELFFKKGRVWGLFWMNTGKITVQNAPGVYMLYLPEAIPETAIADNPELIRLRIGFDTLKHQVAILPDEGEKNQQAEEFIKLKKSKGLYAVHENMVAYKSSENDPAMKSFFCNLKIPSTMHQGSYTVSAFIFQNGKGRETDRQTLKIEQTGLPAAIVSLAFDHGLFYGILSALIALTAGLLMGFIFKGQKGAH